MDRGEIGKLPTFVNIPAAHRCNQGTSKREMRVVNVIMVGGSRFFCLAPCLYVWNSFNLVVVVVLAAPTGPSRVAGADQPPENIPPQMLLFRIFRYTLEQFW